MSKHLWVCDIEDMMKYCPKKVTASVLKRLWAEERPLVVIRFPKLITKFNRNAFTGHGIGRILDDRPQLVKYFTEKQLAKLEPQHAYWCTHKNKDIRRYFKKIIYYTFTYHTDDSEGKIFKWDGEESNLRKAPPKKVPCW